MYICCQFILKLKWETKPIFVSYDYARIVKINQLILGQKKNRNLFTSYDLSEIPLDYYLRGIHNQ